MAYIFNLHLVLPSVILLFSVMHIEPLILMTKYPLLVLVYFSTKVWFLSGLRNKRWHLGRVLKQNIKVLLSIHLKSY